MTREKVLDIIKTYSRNLDAIGYTAKRSLTKNDVQCNLDLRHVNWMCEDILGKQEEFETEKLMRWLGFIQGVLYVWRIYSIDEMRQHNMPEGAKFKERE